MSSLATSDPVLFDFAALVGDADPISVRGNGTRWHVGGALADAARVVEAPAGIVDYQPSEMIVVVRAGTPVAALHAALAAAGQTSRSPTGAAPWAVRLRLARTDSIDSGGSVRDAVRK